MTTVTIRLFEPLALFCSFESGEYFALDMGGTNFRTVYVNLSDKHGEMVRPALFSMAGNVLCVQHGCYCVQIVMPVDSILRLVFSCCSDAIAKSHHLLDVCSQIVCI